MPQIIDQTTPPCQYVIHLDPFERHKEYTSYIEVRNDKGWSALGCKFAPLGNNTKSTPALTPSKDTETARKAFRRKGYKLLATARQIAPKQHRVRDCMCHPGKDKSGKMHDSVKGELSGGKASIKKVAVCGSVSACPICAPKIMSRKQQEVLIGCRNHRKNGGSTAMVTRTNPHKRNNDLKEYKVKMAKALSRMKASRAYKNIRTDYGIIGTVRNIESPHGQNGWHLHTHEALFLKGGLTPNLMSELQSRMDVLWRKYCLKYDLGSPSKAHGLRIDYRESDDPEKDAIGSYITKQAQELTGGINKESKHGGMTYWGMLSALSDKWDFKTAKLAREHMVAMKGVALLYWSPGLKDLLNVREDMEKEEEARRIEAEEEEIETMEIPVAKWYAVVRGWKQARVCEVMEKHGIKAAVEYVDMIYERDTYERKRLDKEKSDVRKWVNESTIEAMKREGVERLLEAV